MRKKWLYLIVIICSVAGSMWVLWNRVYYSPADPHSGLNLCLFRHVTGLPCPSCGSTRAVLDISRFEFRDALYANPIGYLVAFAIVVFPFWVLADIIRRRNSFYNFYRIAESVVRKRWVAISLVSLIAINWLWNIYKFTS